MLIRSVYIFGCFLFCSIFHNIIRGHVLDDDSSCALNNSLMLCSVRLKFHCFNWVTYYYLFIFVLFIGKYFKCDQYHSSQQSIRRWVPGSPRFGSSLRTWSSEAFCQVSRLYPGRFFLIFKRERERDKKKEEIVICFVYYIFIIVFGCRL